MDQTKAFGFADNDVIRSYEDAATAIGRLDAAGQLAPAGLRELLILRCAITPFGASSKGMIALMHGDGEWDKSLSRYENGLRVGAAGARGGALPSVASLHDLLQLPPPAWPAATTSAIDDLLRDMHTRTPPVLKAARAAQAIHAHAADDPVEPHTTEQLTALAVTLVLCVGGAITDAWLTLPLMAPHSVRPAETSDQSLRAIFVALARDARAAERGLVMARELIHADQLRVRGSLGRAAYSALDVLALLSERIVLMVPDTARTLGITPPTAGAAIARLVELGIAREITGNARSRAFVYTGIVAALQPE